MRGILNYDGPIVGTLSKIGDAVILNLLILLCSIPVVTAGAALTAGHFAALKMLRGESNLFSDFWGSFKENFKQATGIWLILLAVMAGSVFGIWKLGNSGGAVTVICGILFLFAVVSSFWIFPVLAKFVNTTANTIRNGFVLCFRHLFRTACMLIAWLLPAAVLLIYIKTLPVVLLFGISVPVLIGAWLYNSVFKEMEKQVLEQQN